MKNKTIAILMTVVFLAGVGVGQVYAKRGEARVWVDVTHQSPNIFTNAEECPKDHPAQLWLLEEKYNSVGHRIRVCGQYNAKGEVMVSGDEGKIINP